MCGSPTSIVAFARVRWTPCCAGAGRCTSIRFSVGAHHLSRFVFVTITRPGIVHLFGRPQEDVD